MTDRPEWKMPSWMEPFRHYIGNTGGNSIEKLMNDHKTTAFNNVILAGLIVSVDSQINLLHQLFQAGLLKAPPAWYETFYIDFSGEPSAGLRPFTDEIEVVVDAGDPGGEPGEFTEHIRQALAEWYDGAGVMTKAEMNEYLEKEKRLLNPEDKEEVPAKTANTTSTNTA